MSFWKPGKKQPSADSASITQEMKKGSSDVGGDETTTVNKEIVSKLSKGTMSMKFMKRKIDSDQQDRENALKRRLVIESQWSSEVTGHLGNKNEGNQELHCERDDEDPMVAFPGRRSFRGFNPVAERQYQAAIEASKFDHYLDNKKHEDLSSSNLDDEEMVQRYSELVGLPRGPSQGRMSAGNRPGSRQSKGTS